MNEKKLAAIATAYGDAWKKVKHFCDPDGFIERQVIAHGVTNNMEPEKHGFKLSEIRRIMHSPDGYYKWRLASLEGADDNNGWIRLDEKEPTLGDYYVCRDGEFDGEILHSHEITLPGNPYDVTHWRLIERPNPPLY